MNNIDFIENKGQWEDNIVFKATIPGGDLYLEENEITYLFYNEGDMERLGALHHHEIKNPTPQDFIMNLHAFKIKFLNAHTEKISAAEPTSDYVNYFIGNDKNKWASNVKKYKEVTYKDIYNNIGLKFYLKEGYLKYDFVVQIGGNPNDIQIDYEGVDEIVLEKGEIKITTSVNEMIEQKPYAYQIIRGKQKEVKCNFKLENNIVSFDFPRGYNKKYELIIDPLLVFCSYSGSAADNWGYTSTFDDAGHLYGGGVTFGNGYPSTTGAFQATFAGGNGNYAGGCDITITKFSPDGTSLIYSTYIGGSGNESPHSLIVNSNNELLIMGTTASANYPVSATAYDNTFNGGVTYTGSIPNYIGGSDIVISKLNPSGTVLLASTFIGGSGNDGLNTGPAIQYNYADDYRGEIIIDVNDNVFVATSTSSIDFPVSAGAFQPNLSGGQDGCVFKLSPNLDVLLWSSYLGGTSNDAAYSLQTNSMAEILITGGTVSADFPTTASTIQPTFQGNVDGWITKINSNATSILVSTFIGTPDYDQTFFVQLDTADNVFVVGQTEGTYPITPATVYNVPNSGQFIHKLSSDLTSTVFSTTFGTGSGEVDIALSAFLVNECNYIFVSGWGGNVNVWNGGAPFSTTFGLPVTANAIQSTTDGSDYYLMMLDEDAASLKFATFFGGNSSDDHVDGGTSRFDKKGIVYQAVCASCNAATTDFPTTPGAWSNTDNSSNCNLGVFKIDLSLLTADAEVFTTPFYCINDTVYFQNLSNGGASYFWDFGDGVTSSLFEPSHVFDTVGTYSVMLIAIDSISCILQDTDYVEVYVGGPPVNIITPVNGICRGDSTQLNIAGGTSYAWTPNYNILNSNTDTPTVFPDTTMIYTVITTDSCGFDTSQVQVVVFQKYVTVDPDTIVCFGESIQINAYGGVIYLWSPPATLNNPNIAGPIATPIEHTTYTVIITDTNSCPWDTTITVKVDSVFPVALGSANGGICEGDSINIYASGGVFYSWSPTSTLTNPNDSSTMAFPSQTTNYVIEVSNACGVDYDTVLVQVQNIIASIVPDTIVCAGNTVNLWAIGGVSYFWYSIQYPSYSTDSSINPIINVPDTFYVDVTDATGCTLTLSVFADTLALPTLELGDDVETKWGTLVTLNPITNGINFWWSPATGLSCTTCQNPIVTATETSTYYLITQGVNGCYNYDTITIYFDGSIYVPNSFTPDGNGVNDFFYAYGKDIVEFEMYIFDRWGEKLFYSDDMSIGWDGTYQGKLAKNDVYVWKVIYEDILGTSGTLYGTATLIR